MAYLDGVLWTENEFQTVCLAFVKGVRGDLKVHEPGGEVVGFDECDAGRELFVHLVEVSEILLAELERMLA